MPLGPRGFRGAKKCGFLPGRTVYSDVLIGAIEFCFKVLNWKAVFPGFGLVTAVERLLGLEVNNERRVNLGN